MNTDTFVNTLKNALASGGTAMAQSVLTNARRQNPELFNRALKEFNADQERLGRPHSPMQPVALASTMASNNLPTPPRASLSAISTAVHTVNTTQDDSDDLESIDDDEENEVPSATTEQPDYDEFDEAVVEDASIDEEMEDESLEEEADEIFVGEEGELPVGSMEAEIEEDFADEEEAVEEVTIETLSYRHALSISIYLDNREGAIIERDGTFFTTHQPLRRGKGQESDATGAVRAALDAFVEGVKMEGESVRFPVAIADNIVESYVYEQARSVEARLNQPFDMESGATVNVGARFEQGVNAWGGNALVAIRDIDLHFGIPAIVSAARKQKDEAKMLSSNLKIVNNLVAMLKDSATVESVQVNILIHEEVMPDLINVFNGLISEGTMPRFNRGYAVFTITSDQPEDGEAVE